MEENAQKKLDRLLQSLEQKSGDTGYMKPRLLLHVCCAPCSSYVLEYLVPYFRITVFWANPNIGTREEHDKRSIEVCRLIREMGLEEDVDVLEAPYEPGLFAEAIKGLENEPERGKRCDICYRLRLEAAARIAADKHYDWFTTTLSISPHKKAEKLNEIGHELERQYGTAYLDADFKKKGGYLRSIRLSEEYGLYRQNFCGCVYSKRDAKETQIMSEQG